MKRLFLGAPVAPETRANLSRLPRPEERPVDPDKWHLTIAFLGDRDEDEVTRRFEALGPLPPAGRQTIDRWVLFTSVIAVGGLPACDTLLALERLARAAFDGIEARPLFPHVTLARFRPPRKPELPPPFEPFDFIVDKFALYESENGVYRIRSQRALALTRPGVTNAS